MKYHKIVKIYADELNRLGDFFSSKQAQNVGLPISALRKMRFRGIIERIQYKSNEFIWRKTIDTG